MVRAPVRVPEAVGVNVTLIVQLALGPKVDGQLLTLTKSALISMLLMVNVAFPVLVRVTACAALEVPTG
jgi:hypothetical protein